MNFPKFKGCGLPDSKFFMGDPPQDLKIIIEKMTDISPRKRMTAREALEIIQEYEKSHLF